MMVCFLQWVTSTQLYVDTQNIITQFANCVCKYDLFPNHWTISHNNWLNAIIPNWTRLPVTWVNLTIHTCRLWRPWSYRLNISSLYKYDRNTMMQPYTTKCCVTLTTQSYRQIMIKHLPCTNLKPPDSDNAFIGHYNASTVSGHIH